MGKKWKPVQPTEIKDIKIIREVIAQIRKPIPQEVYDRLAEEDRMLDRMFVPLKRLEEGAPVSAFRCRIEEYADYLREEAFRAQDDHIAKTWLLRERESGAIAAYMPLIADAVKLSTAEKELHKLDYPFKTIPAMKIGKLAVSEASRRKYKGLGALMVWQAEQIARGLNADYCAARFLTVDADIEHDPGVLTFYEKLRFAPNAELPAKKRKTISMRRDLYV